MATEFVGIELQLMGAEGVRRDLESLDRLLNSFRGRKKFDMGLSEARAQVIAYKGELEKLKREYSSIIAENKRVISNSKDSARNLTESYKKGLISLKEYREGFHELATQSREAASSNKAMNAEIDDTRQKMWNAQQAVREFGYASREAGKTFQETFNSISSKVAHIGSALQSFGNALTQLTSPFRRLTSGVLLGAGFKVFNSFTEGFERGFTRYDTMKKYPKIMAAFGYSAEQAEKSINALDMSVRGLPTGLDEMVDLAQRFTATTGDIDKGTKLAIAANNAFLASMSTDTQKYQGMMQLQDVLGGKDMNAREWNSLVSSMTPAIVKMGEAQGYTNENMSEWIQKVRDGKVANDEFIDTLIKIGTEGGVLEKMAYESKDTWQAFFANVGNAAARMTAGIIQSMDEIVKALNIKDKDGNDINSVNMLLSNKVIPAIDSATASVKKWIQAHPEEITNFFKNLSKIKVGNILRGYAKGLGLIVGLIERLANVAGKHPKAMTALGWLFGAGGMIGRGTTIIGGLLKGTRHIWALIGAGGSWLLKGKLGKLGIFGKLASLFGKKKDIDEAGDVAKSIPSISNTFKSAFNALEGLIKAAGAVLIVGTTGFVAFKEVKSILKDLGEISEILNGMTWLNAVDGVSIIMGIGVLTKVFQYVGEAMGPQGLLNTAIAGAASLIVGGSIAGILTEIKFAFNQLKDTITTVQEIANQLSSFETPDIDVNGIIKTIDQIDQVYAKITGQGQQTAGGRAMQALGFLRNPVAALGGGLARGAGKAANAGLAASKYGSMLEAIRSLKSMASEINSFASITIAEGAVDNAKKVTDAVNQIIKNMPSWTQGITGPKNLKKNTANFADALIGIRRMAYHINKMAGTTVDTGGFATFVGQIKTALESLKELNGELMLDIEVKLSPMFGSSVAAVKKNIKQAKSDIKKMSSAISLVIPVHVRFSLTTNLGAILGLLSGARERIRAAGGGGGSTGSRGRRGGVQASTGGMIYRAGGGGIPFRRRGTDTVPAMLTPGEYVHNRQAVSTFGIEFMRKVNNLDMRGAMNELMHKAGNMATINRGTTITNNNYNNQKVVINNSNAGAGYTFRTASRFVGAF